MKQPPEFQKILSYFSDFFFTPGKTGANPPLGGLGQLLGKAFPQGGAPCQGVGGGGQGVGELHRPLGGLGKAVGGPCRVAGMIGRNVWGREPAPGLHTVLKIGIISLGGACEKISQARFARLEGLRFKL